MPALNLYYCTDKIFLLPFRGTHTVNSYSQIFVAHLPALTCDDDDDDDATCCQGPAVFSFLMEESASEQIMEVR